MRISIKDFLVLVIIVCAISQIFAQTEDSYWISKFIRTTEFENGEYIGGGEFDDSSFGLALAADSMYLFEDHIGCYFSNQFKIDSVVSGVIFGDHFSDPFDSAMFESGHYEILSLGLDTVSWSQIDVTKRDDYDFRSIATVVFLQTTDIPRAVWGNQCETSDISKGNLTLVKQISSINSKDTYFCDILGRTITHFPKAMLPIVSQNSSSRNYVLVGINPAHKR